MKTLVALAVMAGLFVSAIAASFIQTPTAPVEGTTLPQSSALFESSLQSRITSSDTSMTLVSTSTASGEVLPNGYHCFTLDEGRTDAEFVCGTLTSAKTVTSLERGLSYLTATTTVSANQHAHRVGADVKVTDYPVIQRMRNQLNGNDTIPNLLSYVSTVCSTSSGNTSICDKAYVDGVAVAGASNANETTKGIVELATSLEAASSTSSGSTGARLGLPASMATDTPSVVCGATPCVLMTKYGTTTLNHTSLNLADDFNFYTGNITFAGGATSTATTTIAASSLTGAPFKINGILYKYPSTQGASSTVLMNNGSGSLTNEGVCHQIDATTTAAAMVTATSTFEAANYLIITADGSGATDSGWNVHFNGDGAANYGDNRVSVDGNGTNNTSRAQSAKTAVCLGSDDCGTGGADATTTRMHIELRVSNNSAIPKLGSNLKIMSNAGATAPSYVQGSFVWNNTSAQITSVSFIPVSTNIPTGTVIRVIGCQ